MQRQSETGSPSANPAWLGFLAAIAALTGVLAMASTSSAQDPDDPAVIEVEVTADGAAVEGVGVDLFTEAADGSGARDRWLASTVTGPDGLATVEAEPGSCFIITIIAPDGYSTAPGGGGRYANVSVCPQAAGPLPLRIEIYPVDPAGTTIVATVDRGAEPVDGVAVDLFLATADGQRGTWVTSGVTGLGGVTGEARFEVDPGCYVLTFIAPEGSPGFEPDGSPWHNAGACPTDGDLGVAATLRADAPTTIRGSVVAAGQPVPDIQVDLFEADTAGARLTWRDTFRTGADGTVTFPVEAGCWTLTFVAPAEQTFDETGTGFVNRWTCTEPGQAFEHPPVSLGGAAVEIRGQVSFVDGRSVPDASVDLFTTAADGGRGPWRGSTTTDEFGSYRFEVPPGCWTVTFIAPAGSQFTSTDAPWSNQSSCITADDLVAFQSAVLETAGAPDLTSSAPLGRRDVVATWTVDGLMERWEGGIFQPPLLSGDGSTAVFATGARGTRGLASRNVDTGAEVVIVAGGAYAIRPVQVTEDGRGVLFWYRQDTDDAGRYRWWTGQALIDVPDDMAQWLDLAGDGSEVAGVRSDLDAWTAEVVVLTPDGQITTIALPERAVRGENYRFSPDHRYLVHTPFNVFDPTPFVDRVEIATGVTDSIPTALRPVEVADDGDQVRLVASPWNPVAWLRFSTGQETLIDYGGDQTWFSYQQDFDLSGDGSTLVYPQPQWRAQVHRIGTDEVRRIPFEGNEDFAAMSDDGERFLVGEPLTDSTYRLVVLSMPAEG